MGFRVQGFGLELAGASLGPSWSRLDFQDSRIKGLAQGSKLLRRWVPGGAEGRRRKEAN